MGILFGLTAALLQALSYLFTRFGYQAKNSPAIAFGVDIVFGILIWIPLGIISGLEYDFLPETFLITLVSALLAEAFVFIALEKSKLSLTGAIFATYPAFTTMFSFILFKESLKLNDIFSIILILIGILIISIVQNKAKMDNLIYLLPILTAIFVGFSDSLSNNLLGKIDPPTFLFCLAFSQIFAGIIIFRFFNESPKKLVIIFRNPIKNRFIIFGPLLTVISLIFFWNTFENLPAGIASSLSGFYVVILLILSRLFLHEKIARKDLAGIFISTIGVIYLGI